MREDEILWLRIGIEKDGKASAGSGSGSRKKLLKSEMESGTSKKSHQPDQIKVLLR